MSDKFNPQDFGIPANQLTEVNMAMYNKAIKELQKVEKYPTPSHKLRYLMNSVTYINNTFNLNYTEYILHQTDTPSPPAPSLFS